MDKKKEYAKILLNAYYNKLFKIVWNTSGFSLGVDAKRKNMFPELKEKHFIDYAFSIIRIVIDLAEGKVDEGVSEEDLKIAEEIYEHEDDLKNHLFIKKNSKIDCFRLLETQIISYRNDEDPREIEVNSAVVKMMLEKDDNDTSFTFEISRRDLDEIIGKLTELREKMTKFFVEDYETSFPETFQYTYNIKKEFAAGLSERHKAYTKNMGKDIIFLKERDANYHEIEQYFSKVAKRFEKVQIDESK